MDGVGTLLVLFCVVTSFFLASVISKKVNHNTKPASAKPATILRVMGFVWRVVKGWALLSTGMMVLVGGFYVYPLALVEVEAKLPQAQAQGWFSEYLVALFPLVLLLLVVGWATYCGYRGIKTLRGQP